MSDEIESESLDDIVILAKKDPTNVVSKRSKGIYRNSYVKFIAWLVKNNQSLANPEFIACLGDIATLTYKELEVLLHTKLMENKHPQPIQFQTLTAPDFVAWLKSLKKMNGEKLSYSALNTHRAALYNLFKEHKMTISPILEKELSNHFRGLKRTHAQTTPGSADRNKNCKNPISIDLFAFLSIHLLKSTSKDMVFTRTYMVLAWNLMCRASNAADINYNQIQWQNDALCINFPHTKNDQSGGRPQNSRHIYANPVKPFLCPILALGMYWSCFGFDGILNRLFPGSNQYDKFRKELMTLLADSVVVDELTSRGIDPKDIGTNSIHIGAASYVSSGSTASPSTTAIHQRAGWSLEGVQSTNLLNEGAGDQYVGRTLSGLPLDSPDFAMLPPHFPERHEIVANATVAVFPGVPTRMKYVAQNALASLVYHCDYLHDTLDSSHPVFMSPIFRDRRLLNQLKLLVYCGPSIPSLSITPTGIPPHITLLAHMTVVAERSKKSLEALEKSRGVFLDGVLEERGQQGISHSAIDQSALQDTVMRCLEQIGFQPFMEEVRSFLATKARTSIRDAEGDTGRAEADTREAEANTGGDEADAGGAEADAGGPERGAGGAEADTREAEGCASKAEGDAGEAAGEAEGNTERLVADSRGILPIGFSVPNGTVHQMWFLWCCGDKIKGIPPLRSAVHKHGREQDPNRRNLQKRMSDLQFLMRRIEMKAKSLNLMKPVMSYNEANEVFLACQDCIAIDSTTPSNRKRRSNQLVWATVVKLLRSYECQNQNKT